jgi:hypothetical protein
VGASGGQPPEATWRLIRIDEDDGKM